MRAWTLVTAESWAVQAHLVTVLPAFVLGTWLIFASRKGATPHRRLGALYMALMVATAFVAIFIRSGDPPHWSLIHLFVPLTLFSVISALRAARRHDISGHRNAMIVLYVGGLLIAGAFTFSPGRLMHRIFFE